MEKVIEPLLKTNQARLKEGAGIRREAFLTALEKDGQKAIVLAAPEARPVQGYVPDPSKPNQIFSIKVVRDDPQQIEIEVDYHYAGDHGADRVYVDCDPYTFTGEAPFGMRPLAAQVGRHAGRTQLSSYDGTPDGTISVKVACRMASRLDQKTLTKDLSVLYWKRWKK